MRSVSSSPRVPVRDGMRHRRITGYGQLARMILLSLAEREDVAVFREASERAWEDVPRREEIERLPTAWPAEVDVGLWIAPPSVTFPSKKRVPRVFYTQHALSELPPDWAANIANVDVVVVPGEFDRAAFERHHERVHVCHQVVDDTVFKPRPAWRAEGPDRFTFLFVGSFSYRKGVDVLLRAFCTAFPGTEAELWLLCPGAGGAAFNRTLKLVQSLQPRARVRFFTDTLSPAWVSRFYNRVDAFVSLTRGEGWCMPLHEAVLCRKPAIVSRSTAMAEAFSDEHVHFVGTEPVEVATVEDGFGKGMVRSYGHGGCCLYEPDLDKAVERLRSVAAGDGISEERTTRAAQHVRSTFTLPSMGDRLTSILSEAAGASPANDEG